MRYIILITCLLFSILNTSLAKVAGDYRSKQTGAWDTATTWQIYNGSSWVNTTSSPSSSNGKITILSGHEITVSTNITADQVQRIYSDKVPVSGLDLKKTISLPPSASSGIYVITVLAGKEIFYGKIVCRKGL